MRCCSTCFNIVQRTGKVDPLAMAMTAAPASFSGSFSVLFHCFSSVDWPASY